MKLNEIFGQKSYGPQTVDYYVNLPEEPDVDVVVSFDYTPYRAQTRIDPEEPVGAEIYSVKRKDDGTELIDQLYSDRRYDQWWDDAEEAAIEQVNDWMSDDRY